MARAKAVEVLPSMAIDGHTWPYMSMYGNTVPSMALYGHRLPYLNIYGNRWPYMAISHLRAQNCERIREARVSRVFSFYPPYCGVTGFLVYPRGKNLKSSIDWYQNLLSSCLVARCTAANSASPHRITAANSAPTTTKHLRIQTDHPSN